MYRFRAPTLFCFVVGLALKVRSTFRRMCAAQGRVPVLIVKLATPEKGQTKELGKKKKKNDKKQKPIKRPALVFVHDIGQTKEEMLPRMEAAARRGYIAACIDSRYHGSSSGVLGEGTPPTDLIR